MRYLTHHFAHLSTLDRARRWLIHAGFQPDQIETFTSGIPRMALVLAPGQAVEAELVLGAVEMTDPEGSPSFWEIARQELALPHVTTSAGEPPESMQPRSFSVGWRPLDSGRDLEGAIPDSNLRAGYLGHEG